jgi:prepilin-type N-terminal cleavage/methylation domain-containing protein
MRSSRRSRGFTLVELLCVIAVVLTISAISVGHYMQSRQAALKAAAVANMRVIANAEEIFANSNPQVGYVPLGGLVIGTENLIDADLADGEKQGYRFRVALHNGATQYTIFAAPTTEGDSFVLESSGELSVTHCGRFRKKPVTERLR